MSSIEHFHQARRLVTSFSVSMATSVAAELDIAGKLKDGPRTSADLADLCGVQADPLNRVLRFLVSEGVFDEPEPGLFALNSVSHWLRADVTGSLRPRAVFVGDEVPWTSWGHLLDCLKTGTSGAQVTHGKSLLALRSEVPAFANRFDTFMAEQTETSVTAILDAMRFDDVSVFADIGGGRGALVAGLLRAYPKMRGMLLDRPAVVSGAAMLLEAAGVADRCEIFGGDFFEAVPECADVYALKFILHDWDDARCLRVLASCRAALPSNGRVIVVDHLIPDAPEPGLTFPFYMDLNMLTFTDGGRERSRDQFEQLFQQAGLRLTKITPTWIDIHIIEAVAA